MKRLRFLVLVGIVFAAPAVAQNGPMHDSVGPVKPVEVVNDPLIVNIENDSLVVTLSSVRQPFQWKTFSFFNDMSGSSAEECVNIPDDRWLIVEHVSAVGNSDSEVMILQVETNAVAGPPIGTGFNHSFVLDPVFTFSSSLRRFQVSTNAKLYSGPGSEVCIFFSRITAGASGEAISVTFDGILTDQP